MKELPIQIRMGVEQMREKLMIQFAVHCDDMKPLFDQVIKQETEAFLKYGLTAMIQQEAKNLVAEELRKQVRDFIYSNKREVLDEVKKEMEEKAKTEMKNMLYDILGDLKTDKRTYEEDQY